MYKHYRFHQGIKHRKMLRIQDIRKTSIKRQSLIEAGVFGGRVSINVGAFNISFMVFGGRLKIPSMEPVYRVV